MPSPSGTTALKKRGSAAHMVRPPASRSVWVHSLRFFSRVACLFIFILFLLGYISPYLPPELFWWTSLLAAVLPYLSGFALLATLTARIAFGKRWTIPAVVVLLLILARFVPFSRLIAPASEPSEEDLVVMTYNAPVRGPNPDTLARITIGLVERVGPDILALQEPAIWIEGDRGERRATSHVQAIIDSLHYWAPMPRGEGSQFTILQPILARFSLGRPKRYAFSSYQGSTSPTYVTRIPFTWKGQDAVLYNVHLYTTGASKPWHDQANLFRPTTWFSFLRQYRDAYVRRTWEARRLRVLVERERVPVIVAGDFNSTVHGWELRHVMGNLTDAFTVRGEGWGGTYHARLPLFRIDHILVSPEWKVVSAYVPEIPTLSDHRPVVAHLRWRKE